MSETRRDVTDVLWVIYQFGRSEATTDELREVIAWLEIELDDRAARAALAARKEGT